jgi:hypothetical protein
MLVNGHSVLSGYCPRIALSPRFQDNQSPGCAEGATKSNSVKQQTRVVAIQCRIEKCGQKSQYVIDFLDSRVDCPQRGVKARELAGLNGSAGQGIEAVDVGKVEYGVEHQCAQRK